jgi:transposase
MTKRFRDCNLDQIFLLPLSFHDWLPKNHLARFIADLMKELDLAPFYAPYQGEDGRGQSAYDPRMMTRLLLYGYAVGVTSSRRIERATHDDLAFRYLAANQHPDHASVAAFRREQMPLLADLFLQALRLCEKAGLVKLGNVAIDGTKILANASTRRSVPYEKLKESAAYWKKVVDDLLAAAEQTDAQEDLRYGPGQPADPLPPNLADAQKRLEIIRQAKAQVEQEAKEELEELQRQAPPRKRGRPRKDARTQGQARQSEGQAPQTEDPAPQTEDPAPQTEDPAPQTEDPAPQTEDPAPQTEDPAPQSEGPAPQTEGPAPPSKRAKKQAQRARKKAASPTRQHNFVDPDSRVMPDSRHKKAFVQAYNAQAAVDAHAQVIVAAEITQQTNDRHQLIPMTQAVKNNTGKDPGAVLADTGYWVGDSLRDPVFKNILVLVPPDAQRAADQPLSDKAPNTEDAQRMRALLATEDGKKRYGLRKTTVEPVFGQIKEWRDTRRFRLRGLERVSGEWKLICATHNLCKLHRHRYPKPKAKARTQKITGGTKQQEAAEAAFCSHGASPRRYRSTPAYSPQRPNRRSGVPPTNGFSILDKLPG